jgi:hypothetical protein
MSRLAGRAISQHLHGQNINVLGDCGKLHATFVEWQQCELCRRLALTRQ